MTNIGSFGSSEPTDVAAVEVDTFDFYGVTFTVPDRVPWVYIGEFSEAAESEGAEAFSAGMRMIRGVIGAEQWPRFRELAGVNCSSFEDLMAPCMKIIEVVSERPTQQPSDSLDGLPAIEDSSRALSSSAESLSPIQKDARIRELRPLSDAAAELTNAI
jgi:hypothetical protein